MWILISINKPDVRHVLMVDRTYVVGRKDCHILIEDDQSISRKHATLKVEHPEANVTTPHLQPTLRLQDCSKFGTVIGSNTIKNDDVIVNHGNEIKFGTMFSKFRAEYEPHLVTTSCLSTSEKRQVRASVRLLGGHVINDWRRDCQLLVMGKISVTIKAICALVSMRPIVKTDYLTDLLKAHNQGQPVPDPDRYLPPLGEPNVNGDLVSFKQDPRRQVLFQGRKVIFFSPMQFQKLNLAIELAGGQPVLMEEDSEKEDIFFDPNTIVMQPDQSKESSENAHRWREHVTDLITKQGLRMIADAEIGYAVIYASAEKYCNPKIPAVGPIVEPIPQTSSIQQSSLQSQAASTSRSAPSLTLNERRMTAVTPRSEKRKNEAVEEEQKQQEKKIRVVAPEIPIVIKQEILSQQASDAVPLSKPILNREAAPSTSRAESPKLEPQYVPTGSDVDPFDQVPSRKRRRNEERKEVDKQNSETSLSMAVKSERLDCGDNKSRLAARIEGQALKDERPIEISSQVEIEPPTRPKRDDGRSGGNEAVRSSFKRASSPQDGFLSTDQARQHNFTSERPAGEESLPRNVTVIEFASLLVPRAAKEKDKPQNQDQTTWKGRVVANFKKFKKVGLNTGLPRIIGGSDLEVHQSQRRPEVEDWFQDDIRAASQVNEMDRVAQAFFDLQPRRKR